MPHKMLTLKYHIKANAHLKEASKLEIVLDCVEADGVGFKIDGGIVSLDGLKKISDDFEEKEFDACFDQRIETPDIVLQQYKKMKGK